VVERSVRQLLYNYTQILYYYTHYIIM
jgi:hypothetical protein